MVVVTIVIKGVCREMVGKYDVKSYSCLSLARWAMCCDVDIDRSVKRRVANCIVCVTRTIPIGRKEKSRR
jgi:hypothetical protein